VKRAFKTLYREGHTFAEAKAALAKDAQSLAEVKVLTDFLTGSTRGIVR
jgi:UDP-N-acetylglucosamine acyltransferase